MVYKNVLLFVELVDEYEELYVYFIGRVCVQGPGVHILLQLWE